MDDQNITFDPTRHFRTFVRSQKQEDGKYRKVTIKYLDTKWRVVWFRATHPEGSITTELLTDPAAEAAVVRATVRYRLGDEWVEQTSHARSTPEDWSDYIEKAETAAIGRALALAGFGTQFAEELDTDAKLADSPVELGPDDLLEADQVAKLVKRAKSAGLDAAGLAAYIEGKYGTADPHQLTVAQGRQVAAELGEMAKAARRNGGQDGGK